MRAERVQATKPSHRPSNGPSNGPSNAQSSAPTRRWTRPIGWAFVLLLTTLLVLPAASAEDRVQTHLESAVETADGVVGAVADKFDSPGNVLFLTERPDDEPDDRWNFTARPPGTLENGSHRAADPHDTDGFQASWTWYLPTTSSVWKVRPGDLWEFELYIEGLEQAPDLENHESSVYAIDVQAVTSEGLHATGSTELSLTGSVIDPHRHTLTATVDEHHQFYPEKSDPQVEIQIIVTSEQDVDPGLRLYYGSLDNPSRLTLPRYPVDALAAMQGPDSPGDSPLPERFCREDPGDECSDDPDPDDGDGNGGDSDDGNNENDGNSGSSPPAPQDPNSPQDPSTGTGTSKSQSPSGLQEQAPEEGPTSDEQPGPDALASASSSGMIVLVAWTLFVASAGSYGRADRTKQQDSVPRIVGRPKQPGTSRGQETRTRTRKDDRKE